MCQNSCSPFLQIVAITVTTQLSIPSGSVNEYQLRLGRQSLVWFIPLADVRGVCRWNCEIPWERVAYLSALDVWSRQGAIQIHIYLTLPYLVIRSVIDRNCDRCDRGRARAHSVQRFTDDDALPKVVKGLRGKHVVDVCVGPSHFLAVTKSGAVYNWGCNETGQLGHHSSSTMDVITKPTRVGASTVAAGCTVAVHCGPLQVRLSDTVI